MASNEALGTKSSSSNAPSKEVVDRLIQLVEQGDVKSLQDILQQNPNYVNIRFEYQYEYIFSDNFTLLHVSAYEGNLDTFNLLLQFNADINAVDEYGDTPLHCAAHNGKFVTVKLLCDRGADINITNNNGETALHESSRSGDVDIITCLLQKGLNVNQVGNSGYTALHWAAHNGKFPAVKLLLDRGADINITNNAGETALHEASKGGDVDVITCLLQKGLNVNQVDNDGDTPLHWAAYNGKFAAVKLLLDRGAGMNITNYAGVTALHEASRSGDIDVITYLLKKGLNVNLVDNHGSTPLHSAAYNGQFAAVKLLLDRGADINITKYGGETALHDAAYSDEVDVIIYLLKKGLRINQVDNNGNTPLHTAAYWGNDKAVKALKEHGADIYITNKKGETPLLTAVNRRKSSVVRYLIKTCKMDITQLDQETQSNITEILEEEISSSESEDSSTDGEDDHKPSSDAESDITGEKSDLVDVHTIMAYEAAMKEGSQSSNQFKLVTLGPEGAGKTTSVSTLLNLPFQPNQESTVGASINSCSVDTHLASSKWRKITAAFQVTEISRQHKREVKAAMSSLPVKPITPVSVKPIPQEVIDEVKAVIASKEDIPQEGHIRIVIFDIGGQEVYYDVHFLFLAIEDVALLVFDCSKGLDDPVISRHRTGRFGEKIATRGMQSNIETIEILLHSVYSRGQTAPEGSISPRVPVVIMLGTHAENVSITEQEFIIKTICQRFDGKPFLEHLPRLKKEAFHFLANSNPNPESVDHLRSTVLKAAELVITAKRPISYLRFEGKILEKMQQAEVRLSRTGAIDIAKAAGVEGEQAVDALLQYFTNKGILLYYPGVKALRNVVFISPQEVSDLVCTVITTHECQPDTADLQQSYHRYNQCALLEDKLLNFILLQFKRFKDKAVLLGLLDKFNLATEVPPSTKFTHEINVPNRSYASSKVFIVPSLLIYDNKVPYCKQDGDIVVQYYFPDRFLPESVFNQLLVKTIQWCCKHKHIVRCIRRGVGYFCFKDEYLQQFQLQMCQSTSSINCYITIQHSHQPPSDMLPVLLQQRQQLLMYLESSVADISKCCIPSAKSPITCLQCPLHEENCTPHVVLDISKRDVLVCHNNVLVIPIPEDSYILLYQETASPSLSSFNVLTKKPKMSTLLKIVVPKVAAYWDTIAYCLDIEIPRVDIIREKCSNNPEKCCKEVFIHWLTSKEGIRPKTWKVLLQTLKEITELTAVTEQIEKELHS